ncbi:hypothetical protein [Roseateles sp.]|uniref:hypothetical protein n=1 Tax=Roseateles sp. TaxID=1971397 RepID=UPI003943D208
MSDVPMIKPISNACLPGLKQPREGGVEARFAHVTLQERVVALEARVQRAS